MIKELKIKYPKYTREENRSCKLSDEQIKEIQMRREQGQTYRSIAKDFDVVPAAIFYWCLPDDIRKYKRKLYNASRIHDYNEEIKKRILGYIRRKRKLYPKEFREYHLRKKAQQHESEVNKTEELDMPKIIEMF